MAAKHPPLQVDDLAGVIGFRTELPDNGRIIAARYEADILAVGLGSHAQAMLLRQRSNLALFHPAERKPQIIELPRRGGEKKIALVARGVDRPVQFRPPRTNDAPHIMAGDETIRPQILRDLQKIGELHRLVERTE